MALRTRLPVQKESEYDPERVAFVTVARDEAAYAEQQVLSVALSSAFQWLVVDDGSTDGTGMIYKTAAAKYGVPLVVVRPNDLRYERPEYRFDALMRHASQRLLEAYPRAEAIGNMDADIIPFPTSVEELLGALDANPGYGGVGGGLVGHDTLSHRPHGGYFLARREAVRDGFHGRPVWDEGTFRGIEGDGWIVPPRLTGPFGQHLRHSSSRRGATGGYAKGYRRGVAAATYALSTRDVVGRAIIDVNSRQPRRALGYLRGYGREVKRSKARTRSHPARDPESLGHAA